MSDEPQATQAETPVEAPEAVAAAPAAEEQPKKAGGKRKVIIGVVVGVLVVAIAGIAYGAYTVAEKAKEQDRRAEVITTTREIDGDLDQIWNRLEAHDTAWAVELDSGLTDAETALGVVESDLKSLKGKVEEVRAKAEGLPSEKASTAYLEVCDELDSAIDECLSGVTDAVPMTKAYRLYSDAREKSDAAFDSSNDAITACNKKKYSDGKSKAKSAQTNWEATRALFVEAHGLLSSPYDADTLAFADACITYAKGLYQSAVLGTQGSVNGYNAQITKNETQFAKVNDLVSDVDGAQGWVLTKIETTVGNLENRAHQAEFAWTHAKELIASGEF